MLVITRKIALKHAVPQKLAVDIAAWAWALYFLWMNELAWGLFFGLGVPAVTTVALWTHDENRYARTLVGRYILRHLYIPLMGLHALGLFIAIAAFWFHVPEMLLLGLTLTVLGHAFTPPHKVPT